MSMAPVPALALGRGGRGAGWIHNRVLAALQDIVDRHTSLASARRLEPNLDPIGLSLWAGFTADQLPDDLLRASITIDDAGEVIWGIVHSHVRSPARPSPTDVALAFYPDALYVLVSLADDQVDPATGAESVRAWRIVDGAVFEVALDVG